MLLRSSDLFSNWGSHRDPGGTEEVTSKEIMTAALQSGVVARWHHKEIQPSSDRQQVEVVGAIGVSLGLSYDICIGGCCGRPYLLGSKEVGGEGGDITVRARGGSSLLMLETAVGCDNTVGARSGSSLLTSETAGGI
jgi:hypothetical protein